MNHGLLLAKGQGVFEDPVEAYKWLNVAAAQGHANALKNRDLLAARLSREQLEEGQRRATQFLAAQSRSSA